MDIVAMPQLGETVTEGTITLWSKAVGDQVEVDDALFEVSTEKVDTEVPSAVAGFVRAILVAEGDTVVIGTPVAVITATADEEVDLDAVGAAGSGRPAPTDGDSDAGGNDHGDDRRDGASISGSNRSSLSGSTSGSPTSRDRSRPTSFSSSASAGAVSHGPGARGSDRASGRQERDVGGALSPVVRRLLGEHGLTPDDVAGTGRDGRISRADVLAAAAQRYRTPSWRGSNGPGPSDASSPANAPMPPAEAAPQPSMEVGERDEVIDFSKARTATAEHMARSLATAAHALVAVEVDYHALDPVRRAAGLSYLPFVARAVIDAVAEFPHLNSSVDVDRLIVHRDVHLGVAVDVDQAALMVPVVRDASDLRVRALSEAIADVADRARRRRLGSDELSGGTITVTNVGSYGTFVTTPIINQPQVAILSTDGVRMAPVAVRTDDGTGVREWGVAVHPVGNLSLSFDHRAFDGAYAAAFLARVRDLLQTRDWSGEVAS